MRSVDRGLLDAFAERIAGLVEGRRLGGERGSQDDEDEVTRAAARGETMAPV